MDGLEGIMLSEISQTEKNSREINLEPTNRWSIWYYSDASMGFPGGSMAKNPPANARDTDSILGSRRAPE